MKNHLTELLHHLIDPLHRIVLVEKQMDFHRCSFDGSLLLYFTTAIFFTAVKIPLENL